MLAIAFATCAFAQPVPMSASYDETTNILTIDFDSNVKTDAANIVINGIIVDDDNGGVNNDYTIRGGSIVNTTPEDTEVMIRPIFDGVVESFTYTDPEGVVEARSCWGTDYADVRAIEGQLIHSDMMRVFLPEGFANGVDGTLTDEQWVDLTYVETTTANLVELVSVQYSSNTNVMRFEFSHVMQSDQLAEDIAQRDPDHPTWFAPGNRIMDNARGEDRNGNATLEYEENVRLSSITFTDAVGSEFTPSVATDITRMDSTVLELDLSLSNQFAMENLDLSALSVTFGLFTFVDTLYNSVVPVVDKVVTVIAEENPLEIVSVTYDLGLNKYIATFDQPLDSDVNSYAVIPKFKIKLADGSDEGVFLSRGDVGLANSDSSVVFTLSVVDAQTVENYLEANASAEIVASVGKNAVINILRNGNRVGNTPLVVIPESDSNKAPELDVDVVPSYDAATNILSVAFDIRLDQAIDTTGFYFIANLDTIRLTGGVASRSGGNKVCDIDLNDLDQKQLESYADKTALRLFIAPYTVLQQSKLNGNNQISDLVFDYVEDTNPPLLDYLWYDYQNNRLLIGSTTTISGDNIDLTKLHISGLDFTLPDSIVEYSPKQVWCYLNSDDTAGFELFDDAIRIALTATLDPEFFTNSDGVYNELATDLVDKSILSNGVEESTLLLGCGRSFNIQSKEAFPTLTRTVFASVRGISDHANWYVANDQWIPYSLNHDFATFTQAELDTVISFFEVSAIKDTTLGAYDLIIDQFVGDFVELVPVKVDVLFADVYGEYKVGRNDTKASFWEHGYFDPNDLPGSETELSNQANVIIVDSYPQSFIPSEQAWFYDEDDEEWDEIAPGSNVTNGLPAIANLYTRFVQYHVDPFEEQWIIEGLAYFSEFVVAGPPEFYGNGATSGFSGGNILTFIGAIQKSRTDVMHTYMYFLYLWEKYGGHNVIREISTSHQIGMHSVATVIDNRQSELDIWLQGKSVLDIYSDFAIANMLDISNMGDDNILTEDDNGIYAFENIDIANNIRGTQMKWKATPAKSRPPYSASDTEWSFSYNFTAYGPYDPNLLLAPETDKIMVSAGGETESVIFTKLNVKALATDTDIGEIYQLQPIVLDENGSGGVSMSGHDIDPAWGFGPNIIDDTTTVFIDETHFPTWIIVSVSGDVGHSFKFTNDDGDEYYNGIYAVQNSILKRKFDIYVVSEKPIYNGSGSESPILIATDTDGNTVQTLNTPEDYLVFNVDNEGVGFTQYAASIWMAETGTYFWELDGYYSNGIRITVDSQMAMTYGQLSSGQNSLISMGEEFALRTSSMALLQGQDLGIIRIASDLPEEMSLLRTTSSEDNLISVSPIYQINVDI
jgi:hypothetical protein